VVFGRKQQRTQTQLLMDELAESYGHLKSAAGTSPAAPPRD
jgi:hypothetical protein